MIKGDLKIKTAAKKVIESFFKVFFLISFTIKIVSKSANDANQADPESLFITPIPETKLPVRI